MLHGIIRRGRPRRDGFTLIEIIIAVAIVAILAGAITPLVFRELMQAREEATLTELETIKAALIEFYEDTGRFPSEAEGLVALAVDPGVVGWQGPYVGGDRADPVTDVGDDSFGRGYVYDLAPATLPAGAADVIVASGGSDRAVTFGSVGGTWTITGDGDDLLALVSSAPVDRDKIRLAQDELELIAGAARRYYEDRAEFTEDGEDLTAAYLDAGIADDAFTDPWNNGYVLEVDDTGSTPVLTLRSRGPDRTDDSGGGDDVSLTVSAIPPGRKTTDWKLGIAQAALNLDPTRTLVGDWAGLLVDLGLDAAFELDGWGRSFAVNAGSRAIFSPGPDGDYDTVADNVPVGIGPDSGSGGGSGGDGSGGDGSGGDGSGSGGDGLGDGEGEGEGGGSGGGGGD